MRRGYLHTVVWVTLATVLALLALYWLPAWQLGDHAMRRVDILADLRGDSTAVDDDVVGDSLALGQVDSCRSDITCIEDYSNGGPSGMASFYAALAALDTLQRPVRIAVLGDSYIEGDLLTADLRALLQSRYGGCGVNFMPICTATMGFRTSVVQRADGWEMHFANDEEGYEKACANFTGGYFYGHEGAWVSARGVRLKPHLDTCQVSTLYYMGSGHALVSATINGSRRQAMGIGNEPGIASVSVEGNIHRITWSIDTLAGPLAFLGLSMDGRRGIVVDNLGLRAASGHHLSEVSPEMLVAMDRVRHYDLVILMYGLNIMASGKTDYSTHATRMGEALDHLKAAMPATSFLVVSVGDRGGKVGDEVHTRREVPFMVATQRKIAQNAGVAFWNMYRAMGGRDAAVRWATEPRPSVNQDFTHVNGRGGRRIATMLDKALRWGFSQHGGPEIEPIYSTTITPKKGGAQP